MRHFHESREFMDIVKPRKNEPALETWCNVPEQSQY